ncbi:hypothetical protein N7493_011134 [Penicillium malachiteum]|uniref:Uncharacterized protein n=1 Tax=Penicillium malachiteum TaxID=1324776 RepID=A0AAD6HBI9_9EURO|nr:hypothetical protein N7493_011134 [Penicillium malachiteum]
MNAAAGNRHNKQPIKFLLSQQKHVQITASAMEAAFTNWSGAVDIILSQGKAVITENILLAAVTADMCRTYSIKRLINQQPDCVKALLFDKILYAAAANGHEEILLVLRKRLGIAIKEEYISISQLREAVREGDLYTVRRLCSPGVPLDTPNRLKKSPLWEASSSGHRLIVKELLNRRQVNVNSTSDCGSSPLCAAASSGHLSTVELLIQAGADPEIATNNGETAYSLAKKRSFLRVAKTIAQYGNMNDVSIKTLKENSVRQGVFENTPRLLEGDRDTALNEKLFEYIWRQPLRALKISRGPLPMTDSRPKQANTASEDLKGSLLEEGAAEDMSEID